jgi:hypothetical protein
MHASIQAAASMWTMALLCGLVSVSLVHGADVRLTVDWTMETVRTKTAATIEVSKCSTHLYRAPKIH